MPAKNRKAMTVGSKREVRVAMSRKVGKAVDSFFGCLGSKAACDPHEKTKARSAMGRRAARTR